MNPFDYANKLNDEIAEGEELLSHLQVIKHDMVKRHGAKSDEVFEAQARVNSLNHDLRYLRAARQAVMGKAWQAVNKIELPPQTDNERTRSIRERMRALYDSPDVAEVA